MVRQATPIDTYGLETKEILNLPPEPRKRGCQIGKKQKLALGRRKIEFAIRVAAWVICGFLAHDVAFDRWCGFCVKGL
jgi:hypothetical protein